MANTQVKATNFSVTIEAPMHKPLVTFKESDIHQLEDTFAYFRDLEQNIVYKRNYDRCRAILKYANSCWGNLENISNADDAIEFIFTFDSIEGLTAFEKDLQKCVEGATM